MELLSKRCVSTIEAWHSGCLDTLVRYSVVRVYCEYFKRPFGSVYCLRGGMGLASIRMRVEKRTHALRGGLVRIETSV
jgi:hypothetical protein